LLARAILVGRFSDGEPPLSRQPIIDAVQAEIRRLEQILKLLDADTDNRQSANASVSPRRGISAEGRRRIAAAARARWAAIRSGKQPTSKGAPPRKKMSAAARNRIAAAQRARWAKIKAEKKRSS
jgi:hypothetical protein